MTDTALRGAVASIGSLEPRTRAVTEGRVRFVEVSSSDGPAAVTARLVDGTGALDCVFLGRRTIAGIEPGARLRVEGMLATERGVLTVFNPRYELIRA